MWLQRTIHFEPRPRGIHLVAGEVFAALPGLGDFGVGVLHLLIRRTSASPTLNENASPEVRADLDAWLDRAVPGILTRRKDLVSRAGAIPSAP